MSLALTTTAFATARFSAEKGARGHRMRLSASRDHTCAIPDDATVQCWGNNGSGQLGDGSILKRSSPVPASGIYGATSVAAGVGHTCAIVQFGAVKCWGDNIAGELGNGKSGVSASSPTPVQVSNIANAVALAAGNSFTCAVRADGTVWCWGAGSSGQLGAGAGVTSSSVPVQVAKLSTAVAVAAGNQHACALLADGTVQCWGDNSSGQLGNSNTNPSSVPVATSPFFPRSQGAADIVAGDAFTCATLSGIVNCWGESHGIFGGSDASVHFPLSVAAAPSGVVALAAGSSHLCMAAVSGLVTCLGDNSSGQLGSQTPVATVANAIELAAGQTFSCAMSANGTIRCWGDNSVGQLGDGSTSPVGLDVVAGINGTFLGRGIAAGNAFTCGRRGTGAVACWGNNVDGQLGASVTVGSSGTPLAVTGLTNIIGISAGNAGHACAVDAQGQAQCWGRNNHGELGNQSFTPTNHPVPVARTNGVVPLFTSISAGDSHSCAVRADGTVWCWGAAASGQLGPNSSTDSSVPVQIAGLFNAVAVSAGNQFSCALIADGTVSCWGGNSAGQLGTGISGGFTPQPGTVTSVTNIVGIAAGTNYVCAVSAFGHVLCWGANDNGQLGNNSTQPSLFFTNAQGLTGATAVSAGAQFTCAAQADTTASCWGYNFKGELAAQDTSNHLTPTPVIGTFTTVNTSSGPVSIPIKLSLVVAMATGTDFTFLPPTESLDFEHACALRSGGSILCWGSNFAGQLGDGINADAARPTSVNGFTANVDPEATLPNQRVAHVTALITCDPGALAHIILQLQQGGVSGTGRAEAQCTGGLVSVPVTVSAQGPFGFQDGAATASVEAIVRDEGRNGIIDDTHWTRNVTLGP